MQTSISSALGGTRVERLASRPSALSMCVLSPNLVSPRPSGSELTKSMSSSNQVESCHSAPHRSELLIDQRELQLVCDLEFGPTKAIQLLGSDRTRALVEFKFVADAVKAMLASLPQSEMGNGGVVFGPGRRFVFEPKKRTVFALYRETASDTAGYPAPAVGPSEDGRYDCGM